MAITQLKNWFLRLFRGSLWPQEWDIWLFESGSPPPPHPQLSIKSKQVYTSPTSTYYTFLESLGQDLSNPAYIGLISGAILTPHP